MRGLHCLIIYYLTSKSSINSRNSRTCDQRNILWLMTLKMVDRSNTCGKPRNIMQHRVGWRDQICSRDVQGMLLRNGCKAFRCYKVEILSSDLLGISISKLSMAHLPVKKRIISICYVYWLPTHSRWMCLRPRSLRHTIYNSIRVRRNNVDCYMLQELPLKVDWHGPLSSDTPTSSFKFDALMVLDD